MSQGTGEEESLTRHSSPRPAWGKQTADAEQTASSELHVCYSDVKKNVGRFPNNYVQTARYTVWNFIPVNLFEQFRKVSNLYFLLNMIVACLPTSPFFPITFILPLIFILVVGMLKDAIEDSRRHKSDKEANGAPAIVIRNGVEVPVRSDQVVVGDVVKCVRDREICCDCLILATSAKAGVCYLETANLDGETNLKSRAAVECTANLTTCEAITGANVCVTCDLPSESLIRWEGLCEYKGICTSLSLQNIAFRGCNLRNTAWAYGLVIYTGTDTKMMRNLKICPSKFSTLDKKLNVLITGLLFLQQLVLLFLAIFSVGFLRSHASKAFYLEDLYATSSPAIEFLSQYLTFFVLLSVLLPISLFVSLELCKACQAKFMELDVKMTSGTKSMKAKTSALNEELARAKYVFTDKTGTLTENKMRFYKIFVKAFSHFEVQDPGGAMTYVKEGGKYSDDVAQFLLAIALCHTVVVNRQGDGTLEYEGQSTDEVALVQGCRDNGYVLTHRTQTHIQFEVFGVPLEFEVLSILEFDSDRKRMSIIVKNAAEQIWLFMKGADTAMLNNIHRNTQEDSRWYNQAIVDLDQMAKEGLRTLVVAAKQLDSTEFAEWKKVLDKANLSMDNRSLAVSKAYSLMEREVSILGTLGIEDRLQEGVPESIEYLSQAGLVIWMLTGDKRETAISIASSSKLINIDTDTVHHLHAETVDELDAQMKDVAEHILRHKKVDRRVCMIIDGPTLDLALKSHCRMFFTELSLIVSCAICCRVTPIQKARVVALFQQVGFTSLAIGDGANDVSMIQEAKVGIGIMGLEGCQAELASDYSIPKFQHLVRLIAVHGRFSLVRNATLVQVSLYKNLVLCLTQVYFNFDAGFSGQTLFDSWVQSLYNLVFTALMPLVLGVFEKDIDDDIIMQHPQLFKTVEYENWSGVQFAKWGVASIVHSLALYYFTAYSMPQDDTAGYQTSDIWTQGSVSMTSLVMVVIVKNAIATQTWTWVQLGALLTSIFLYFVFIAAYAGIPLLMGSANYYAIFNVLIRDAKFYLWIILFSVLVCVPDVMFLFIQQMYRPSYKDQIRFASMNRKGKQSTSVAQYKEVSSE